MFMLYIISLGEFGHVVEVDHFMVSVKIMKKTYFFNGEKIKLFENVENMSVKKYFYCVKY